MKATADAIAEATRALEVQKRKLVKERDEIEGELYRVEAALKAIHDAFNLQRVRRKTRDKVCIICGQEFKAKTDLADLCGKKECIKARREQARRGTTLIPGDNLSQTK